MDNDNIPHTNNTTLLILFIGMFICSIAIIITATTQNNFSVENFSYILLSVGCSIIAAALVPLFMQNFAKKCTKIYKLHSTYGISNIYKTRAEMNTESNIDITNCKNSIDICALGLTGFKSHLGSTIKSKVQSGVKIRILSPHPDSPYLTARDAEEGHQEGELQKNIKDLCSWVDELNGDGLNNVQLKFYDALLLNSYMRVDKKLFIGPYWYKKLSQQTVSFSFSEGNVLQWYSQYFEDLWNNDDFCRSYK